MKICKPLIVAGILMVATGAIPFGLVLIGIGVAFLRTEERWEREIKAGDLGVTKTGMASGCLFILIMVSLMLIAAFALLGEAQTIEYMRRAM